MGNPLAMQWLDCACLCDFFLDLNERNRRVNSGPASGNFKDRNSVPIVQRWLTLTFENGILRTDGFSFYSAPRHAAAVCLIFLTHGRFYDLG